MAICEVYGAEFDLDDTYWAISDYDCDIHGGMCPSCAQEYEDDCVGGSVDRGCEACGNPDYPRCKSSCSAFDD